MTRPAGGRIPPAWWRRPDLVLGVTLILTGWVLCGPILWHRFHCRVVTGRILDVLPVEQRGQMVRLSIVFEYPLARSRTETVSRMGAGRVNAFGQPLGDLYVEARQVDPVVNLLMADDRPRQRPVFVSSDEPGGTAGVFLGPDDPDPSARSSRVGQLGLVLILSPILAWGLRRILDGMVRRSRPPLP